MGATELMEFLDRSGIAYQRCDHPAVYTVEEAARLVPPLPGAKTKNLFLREKPGRRHFLVCVPAERQADLRTLSDAIGCGRLSYGSADRLMARLGVEPGAVTLHQPRGPGLSRPRVGVELGLAQGTSTGSTRTLMPLSVIVTSAPFRAKGRPREGPRFHVWTPCRLG